MAKPPMLRSETPAQLEHRLINEGWYDRLPEPMRTENLARAARIMAKGPQPGVHKRDGIFAVSCDNGLLIAIILAALSGALIGTLAGAGGIWVLLGMVTPC